MAGEADTQLDIKPREGMHFFTFTLRDALGREMPGQMEARSEEAVRSFLSEYGYDLVEIRQGWYAMKFVQSPADRRAAVERALRGMIQAILGQASEHGADAMRISLDAAVGRVVISQMVSGEWRRVSEAPPEVYPAGRDWLAERAGVTLAEYNRRYRGTLPPEIAPGVATVGAAFEGNTTELSLGAA